MKKKYVIIIPVILVIILLIPYRCERENYHVLTLAEANPTSYVFNMTFDSIFTLLDGHRDSSSTYPLSKLGYKYKMGIRRFKKEHNGTIELYGRFGTSPLYRFGANGLKCYFQCRLIIDSLSINKTEVRVEPLYYGILKGWNKYIWSEQMLPWVYLSPSSTVEEYQLLRYIGDLIGEKNMPEIHYPIE